MILFFEAGTQSRCRFSILAFILLPFISFSQLFSQKANFYANITEGCNSLNVQFTDDSEGATSWRWDLGNGNISTLQNPLVNYIQPGEYTVKLTINGTFSAEKNNYIKVYNNPAPDFTSDISSGCVPLEVQFSDRTTASDGAIESWVWLIDGASLSEENPTFTFNRAGSYKVTLMAIDEHGCYGNTSKSKFISVGKLPNVDFNIRGSKPCELPYHPSFKNTTTIDGVDEPFVYINNWKWKINDELVSEEQELNYVFDTNGDYTISLAAQMGACTDSIRVENAINLSVDSLDYSIIKSGTGVKDSIHFRINNSSVAYVEWELGDGSVSNKKEFNYCYADTGRYEVSINAILGNGCNLYRTSQLVVFPAPLANFSYKRKSFCNPPYLVEFTNTSKMTDKVIWDFGDGTSSESSVTVNHTYNSTGEYFVKLIAYDGAKTDTVLKNIKLYPPETIPIQVSRNEGCVPLEVQFSKEENIDNLTWDFGDGQVSTLQSPIHTFTDEGVYKATLNYTNDKGCSVSSEVVISGGEKPIVDFEVNQTDSCNQSSIELVNNSSNYQLEEWNIGDSYIINSAGDYHLQFISSGYKSVELKLDNYGCKASQKKEDDIYIKPPVAFFFMDNPLCEAPAQSYISNYANQYDAINWNFGDGTQTQTTPLSHIYQNVGNYYAYQTVENYTTGCSDYMMQAIHVSITDPDFAVEGANEGCLPFEVSFIDKTSTTGTISRWYWNYGDGHIDTTYVGETSHVYTSAGEFDVKLTVKEYYGCREVIVKENAVKVNTSQPKISFVKDEVCVDEIFELRDISTSTSNIIDRTWFFADGVSKKEEIVQHAFSFPGEQEVVLSVTDEKGCSYSDTLTLNVLVSESIFILDDYACTNSELQIQNISLGNKLSHAWDFGDGGRSTALEPQHIYNTDGIYDVSLTVTNENGCTSTSHQSVEVITPKVDFDAYKTELGCARNALPAVFYDRSSDDIYMWEWDFGDGEGASSSYQNPQYLYNQPGYFDVTLMATSKGGCTIEVKKEDFIHLTGPVGSIITDVSSGCVPLIVNYSTTTDSENEISWDVGDGTNDYNNQYSFSHAYNEARSFFPSIILTDKDGCTMEYEGDPIVVDNYPDLSFTSESEEVCEGTALSFQGEINLNSSQLSQVNEIVWNFGDNAYSNNTESPSHVYQSPGTYDVELYIKTSIGCSAKLKKENFVTVFKSTLQADIISSKRNACLGESILFTNNSKSDYSINEEYWDFNKEDFARISPVTYAYKEAGVVQAKLTVVDEQGCIDSTFKQTDIKNIEAAFTLAPKSGSNPLNVQFTDQSLSDGQIQNWDWNFGDNTSSIEQHPKHTFIGNQVGSEYQVSLTVSDSNNCTSTKTDTVYAINHSPVALNDTIIVQEDNVAYANLSDNDYEPDGQSLIYNSQASVAPSNGEVIIAANGQITYTPNANYYGADSLEYTVCDNGNPVMCASAKVIIEVLSVVDLPPVAVVDRFDVYENETFIGSSVLLNDIDNEGMGLSVQFSNASMASINGNVVLSNDGTFTYTPHNNFVGKDSIQYFIIDNAVPPQADSSWIVFNVLHRDQAPIANTDVFYTDEEVPVVLSGLADNDTDRENNIDVSSIQILEPVLNGSISSINNQWVFTPEKDFYGMTLLYYSISDYTFLTATGEIIVYVKQVNDPPIANDDYAYGFEDVPLDIDILSNDVDPDNNIDPSSFKLISSEVSDNVSFNIETGILSYYPAKDYIGSDVLRYEICDSAKLCSRANIYITLAESFDDAPVTKADTIWLIQGLSDTINVLANDTDLEDDIDKESLSVLIHPASYPDVTVLGDGQIKCDYAANSTFIGSDSLIYEVCDLHNNCSQGTLHIVVKPYKESIFIPQAITPNGDGKNDLFVIKDINKFPSNRLLVYNRWETEVYSAKAYDNSWDGTTNGKALPDGTYYYLLYLFDEDEPIKGFIYISR